ncbi:MULTISPECIES: SAM-dependent methyltransferase [unclassified Amycolatopsis]|uniref:SAM-dependent methyltransferase n=1 Tax=unclassified Amycolatopsis TaxID=2618356 RepID=UPI002E1A537C|nr:MULTISPECIES: SAM-dependent methyltransferase [unclassified Amycolatopsis]
MTPGDLRSGAEGGAAALDFSKASLARLSDALLGGHDHYEVDREAMRRLLAIAPGARTMAKEHRDWLVRAVRFLAGKRGIDQFLDLGSGMPTAENTHQVAQRYNPDAQVVYVDIDPVVQVHGRALLEENYLTHVTGADLTKPVETLADPVVREHLDFSRPVALILTSIVHHIDDYDRAKKIVSEYVAALAPGSYLLLTHNFDPEEDSPRQELARLLETSFQGTGLGSVHRSREQIASFFDGLELLRPGLVYLHEWWPDGPRIHPLSELNFLTLGGVARKL